MIQDFLKSDGCPMPGLSVVGYQENSRPATNRA